MTDLIRALFLWVRLVFGTRRGGRHRARTPQWATHQPSLRPAPAPAPAPAPPAPRSPYGSDVPLDGHASALVRPYLLADEQRQERARQRQRRLAMVLAADFGIDLDIRDLYGLGVA
ncbi:hypothetical protein [Streptomyces vietnamensis]|uniref:Uncharacterized protein n=1 Tax=Streptomyces vietnamensis TaxID=362257 RepID=A0A0B5HYP0_9ACTN|nr:hypothetical protein [Streptomyces vietnamensis]AJF67045.1 hypothetical protein SVTN_24345 [Streptomyces vietnamensis]